MIFIPIIFIFIRIWGLVVDAVDFYADKNLKHRFEFSIVGSIFILAKVSEKRHCSADLSYKFFKY